MRLLICLLKMVQVSGPDLSEKNQRINNLISFTGRAGKAVYRISSGLRASFQAFCIFNSFLNWYKSPASLAFFKFVLELVTKVLSPYVFYLTEKNRKSSHITGKALV